MRRKVRFRTPLIDGAASALSTHVKRLAMRATARDASVLALILTNGDRVAGDLVELTQDAIVVDCPALGEVVVARALVRCILTTSGSRTARCAHRRSRATSAPCRCR